jgi:hypothetical protein
MMIKIGKEIKDNIKLNAFYAIVVVFTVTVTALLLLYNTSPSSFDYRIFAQEEDNKTDADTTTIINTGNLTNSNTTLIHFVSNIEQIIGHIEQAKSNKQAGNNTLVLAHTLHPIEEIYSSIEGQLSNANSALNQTLSSNLNQLSQTAVNSTVDQFNIQAQKVNGLLNQTIEKVVPVENRNDSTFNLMVVADLLPTAESEYKEAVENGTVKEIVEYQDGQGFVSRAQSVFEQTSSLLSSSSMKPHQETANKIQKVNELFSDLNNAIQNKSNPQVVDRPIRAIIHEISEITGMSEESLEGGVQQASIEPIKIIAEIRNILNQTVQQYKQGNYNEAETLAIRAYLDNYEFIENAIAEKDKALMQNIEVMLREQLRQIIQSKVAVEELQQHIDKINSNLDQAEKKLLSAT